jgi:hypothetical protein
MPAQRVSKARGRLQRDRLVTFLDDAEQAAGPIDRSVMRQVRREWPASVTRRRRGASSEMPKET